MYVKQLKSDWHKKIMLSVCALFFLSGALWAQNIQVTGKVTDISGEGVPGVYVLIEGTRSGTTTGTSGEYTISAPSNGRLVFSSIGYKTLTVGIVGRSVLNVFMEEDALLLEDIVVVGYGVQRRESLTAAVATVDTKVLEARPIPDIGRGLQGVTPGLSVVNFSGEIGSDAQIRIRGTYASPQGSANPLILLDNVEIPSIQLVNPDDVESISILKDASSASIYGAKAAFGVILITTKKGATRESVNVNYSYNVGFQNISKKMEMGGLDAFEYVAAHLERFNSTVSGAFVLMTREGYQRAKEWDAQYKGVIKSSDPWVYGRDWYVDANNYKIGLRPYDPY
ncbi:MAG: TonB-dependent receptor plug domain-containing protein, partial [Bacteroidales bacterium]|nr:TonB-dependent receptor plug domain-containing protein [Bacteroidales bacterium]